LADDPDGRLVRWGWIAWFVLTLFIAIAALALGTGAAAEPGRWLAAAVLVAFWLLWPLWRGGGAAWQWMRAAPHRAWNGSYYEFDGRQMRVLFDADEVFLVADDVFAALDLRGHAADVTRVRLVAGRDGLRQLDGRRELVFTERGLTAWLERRRDPKAVQLRRWYERDVLAPHRRRRASLTGGNRP
jgi:hypothetical protein